MKRRGLPLGALAAASWETVLRRSMLMAGGRCPPAERGRMVAGKVAANAPAALALMAESGCGRLRPR